jgi:hypothetical protein
MSCSAHCRGDADMADNSTENRRLAECEQQSLAELTCRDHDGVFFHLQCKSVELEQGNSTLVWDS